jgi:predicted transcriptional regulator of viral defense system
VFGASCGATIGGVSDASKVEPNIGAKLGVGSGDAKIATLADRQHGVVGRVQLVALGLGRQAIAHRLSVGRLHRVHRGVYAVGHRVLTRRGWWMAAVLAGGPGAALSHHSAAALWGFRDSARTRIDVTTPTWRSARPGLQLHTSAVPPEEITTVDGIPTTTVPRTLLDLAAILSRHRLERAVNEAEVLRLTDPLSLAALLARYPRRAGSANLRAILESADLGSTTTRSELEDRFLAFLDAAVLPRPIVNANLELSAHRSVEVDCLWPEQRLVVELDGHAFHATPAAYERDRARDRALSADGWRVVRVTWRQLHLGSEALAADLRRLLTGQAASRAGSARARAGAGTTACSRGSDSVRITIATEATITPAATTVSPEIASPSAHHPSRTATTGLT